MQDKLDELHYIYKMIGNYGFCTVQELLDKYNKQKEVIDKLNIRIEENKKNIDESGSFVETYTGWKLIPEILEELLDILKEVQE